ncbi:hypothetical protein MDAP_000006 [Mitosporidium daphniae]|uniref:Subunit Rrp11 of DNA-directed RNA polymerase II n=1 Tax=Mitosporidium daphniae TaxID=1485682 RepID=A0A098VRD9_9MICR|nr:subunit Rrp11 of DNA-directed RNA polymerase II [Mitosporidium daphniae]KGG50296.1 subunit Rrp11 of DNA-directed RNA polymerase II [Mitosporidium daphniae]|eukprot:XP_013236739.1 subunit Rrp11 of DNA-directed RNA polymerase II [Mitosporidium daphniae]
MNAPEPHELFFIPEGHSKVEAVEDTRLPNTTTYTIYREDHTLGTILTSVLQKQKTTLFAAYKVPHPLEHNIQIRIQTTPQFTPQAALISALETSISEWNSLDKNFITAVENFRNNPQQEKNFH